MLNCVKSRVDQIGADRDGVWPEKAHLSNSNLHAQYVKRAIMPFVRYIVQGLFPGFLCKALRM